MFSNFILVLVEIITKFQARASIPHFNALTISKPFNSRNYKTNRLEGQRALDLNHCKQQPTL